MELVAMYQKSLSDFADRTEQAGREQLSAATPCSEWDVRALLNHVVSEDRWLVPLLAGSTIADVGDRFDGDLLGADPMSSVIDAAKQAGAAISEPGALDRVVQLSFGPTPAREYVWQMLAEHLIHTWDLAAATGGDRRMDPESVRECARWFVDREDLYRESGGIGPRVEVPAGASEQDRLLAAFGRDPGWSTPV